MIDKKMAQSGKASEILGGIVALSFGLYFFVNLFVPALTTLAEANTTALEAGTAALVVLVGVVSTLSGILLFIRAAGIKIM